MLTCCVVGQVHEKLLTSEEADECISIEFNPVRAGFHGSHDHDVWTRDVLNLGVKPDKLIAKVAHCNCNLCRACHITTFPFLGAVSALRHSHPK